MEWMVIVNDILTLIIFPAVLVILGALGVQIGITFKNWLTEKQLVAIAETVVLAVEQLYSDLKGPEKLDIAIKSMSRRLSELGIKISPESMREMIESVVGGINLGLRDDDLIDHDVDIENEQDSDE